LLSDKATRSEVAVSLLAVLELIKRREVSAVQETLFGPIVIVGATAKEVVEDIAAGDEVLEFEDF